MKKVFILFALVALVFTRVSAQESDDEHDKWFFGFGEGLRWSSMHFSDIDQTVFPDEKSLSVSPTFSIFLERNFGEKGLFGIRPELTWVRRGGVVGGIYSQGEDYEGLYEYYALQDIRYKLKANYIDLRVPLFLQLGNRASTIRPYIFVAPVFGLVTSGSIRAEDIYTNGAYDGIRLEATKANLAQTYFGAQAGLGLKWFFNCGRHRVYLDAGVSYEVGVTDTYGSDEKDGRAIVRDETFYPVYNIQGNRKFRGFEARLSVGIPFSVFRKAKASAYTPAPEVYEIPASVYTPPVIEEAPVIEEVTVVEEPLVIPCYSFEEISEMIDKGEDVSGLTFCAVEGINFEYGKSTILPTSYAYLDRLAEIISKTGMHIDVKGHTDNKGSEKFNLKLSRERAQAVVNYLVRKGVPRANLSYSFYGMSRPLVSNETEEGRAINRRVEFEILK